jgi:Spy/CpxP family protein refolding chaperone
MNRVLTTGAVAAIAAAFAASVAIAEGQGQGQRRGPGSGGPGGRGMTGILQGLTDEQRTQVRAIMQEQREGQQLPPADAKLRRELEAELLADAPNDQKIEELKQQILSAHAEGLARHIAVQKRIAQVLTAEQRAKARERLAEAPREGRGRRGWLRH